MPSINPYLSFNGNASEAFEFYKSVFGGEYEALQKYAAMPGKQIPEDDKNLIMHVSLPIGKNNLLMGCDISEKSGNAVKEGNNFSLSITADSKEDADRIYKGLSAGGNAHMPMADAFWGSYFGMLIDKFGINWMVSYAPAAQKS